jgi:endonuclease/exonuclease/phosphatase family metal-dependent hydrolase
VDKEMKTYNLIPILLGLRKKCLFILIIFSLVLSTSCDSASGVEGVGEVLTEVVREQRSFSVLAINLQGIEQNYGGHPVNWPERYSRIADWMKLNETFPDFIALQEVHGQSTSHNQYQVLHTLLTQIKAQTNISYRVAYLTVNPIPFPGSTLWQGVALLYNADRLTNITASSGFNVSDYGDLTIGLQPRKSLPCLASAPMFEGLCSLLDGDGLSWISATIRLTNGRWVTGPVLARFELKAAPGLPIHIYNIHAPLSDHEEFRDKEQFFAQFEDLESQIESKFGSNRLYPPIVLGDFNLDVGEVLGKYPGYEIAGYANREFMGVLVGKQDTFPSEEIAYARALVVPEDREEPSISFCGNVDQLWSDHCGVFVQFSPLPGPASVLPTGPTAQGDVMHSGEVLHSDESISSANRAYTLRLQENSNLFLIRNTDNTVLWSLSQPNCSFGRPVGCAA